jgi:hypothetical protein
MICNRQHHEASTAAGHRQVLRQFAGQVAKISFQPTQAIQQNASDNLSWAPRRAGFPGWVTLILILYFPKLSTWCRSYIYDMTAFRVLFDVLSCKRQWECGPPIKQTWWVIHPAQVWRGNSITHTKIVTVRATIVRFLFQKHVRICETILVKMTCELLKFDKNWLNRRQSLFTYFQNDANWSALFGFWFE